MRKTTCARCAVGCGFQISQNGKKLDVRGDKEHPTNMGAACQRGVRETAGRPDKRIETPYVRKDGELVETDWETAIDRAVELLEQNADSNPDSVAVMGSGQQTNEAAYALGRVTRGAIGTRHYEANTTLCMASAVGAYYQAFGSDGPPPTYEDIPKAERHVVWGGNPAVAHPVMFRWIKQSAAEDDSELVVIDPVETKTADFADHHIRPEPGRDLELARGVLSRIIETGTLAEEFIEENTQGFEEIRDDLPTVSEAAQAADVSENEIDLLASTLERQTLIYWTMGINQSVRGTATAGALIDLCLATGNLGPGTGPFSITGQPNSMGTRVISSKGTWPGHRSFTDSEARKEVADTWDIEPEALPEDPGPGPVEVFEEIQSGEIDVCWTVATNPPVGMPDTNSVENALEDISLIVQDAFHTETVPYADVVLPAATWGEIKGTLMNMERRVSRVQGAKGSLGNARPDLDIITEIGARLGDEEIPTEPEAVFDEFRSLTAGTPADLSGITYDRLAEELAVRWPAPDTDSEGDYRYHEEGKLSFPTPSEKARFSDAAYEDLPETPNDAYPLLLNTGRKPDAYNSGVRSREGEPAPLPARLHPETLNEYDPSQSDENEWKIETQRASVAATLEGDDSIPRGNIWVPIHHPDANALTLPVSDPVSDEPNFKQCAAKLRPK